MIGRMRHKPVKGLGRSMMRLLLLCVPIQE
jgi:hypothetical protein